MYLIVAREPDPGDLSSVGRVLFINEYHQESRKTALLEMARLLHSFEGATPAPQPYSRTCYVVGDLMLELLRLPEARARLDEYAQAFFR